MDGDQKQNKSSALRSLTNDKSINNTKPDPPRRISSSPPQLRKRKPVKYNDDGDYNDIDEEHVVKSDSEDDFEAEQKSTKQKKKKQKKSQKKQVASTSTALVAPTKPTTKAAKKKAEKKAEKEKKTEIVKAHNKKLNEFKDSLKKDNKAAGVKVNNSKTKKCTVKIEVNHKPIRSKTTSFEEQETFLLTEGSWAQDRFKAIMVNYNELSKAEKRPFLERILQDPSSWDDYSSLSHDTVALFSECKYKSSGAGKAQLNFPMEKEFLSMRQKEITSRGLVDQPEFNTARKNSIIRQLVRTIIGEVDKKSKPKKPKATVKLQSTKDMASAAIANGRPQDVIMETNEWKKFASLLYMS